MNKRRIGFEEYAKMVGSICRDIILSNWKPDYVVGVTRGGLLAATMISHYLDVPMHTIKVALRDHADSESNLWMPEDAWGYGGTYEDKAIFDEYKEKNILIVDDINDTGSTINWIINDWQQSCLPNTERWESVWGDNVRFAVIVDNAASNAKVAVSYSAEDINKADDDVWIDFPYESWWK